MKFNEKIKKLRIDNNLTQDDLARICYVSRNAVSKWENDKGYPNLESLKLISNYFKISIDDLLNDEDYKIISLTNHDLLKTYLLDFIIFISYVLSSILIPYFLFKIDPTGVMAYYIFIGPITFIILGIITGILFNNVKHTLLTSLLATIPVFIYLDSTNMNMAFYQLIFYLIYSLFYLSTYFLKKKYFKKKKYK